MSSFVCNGGHSQYRIWKFTLYNQPIIMQPTFSSVPRGWFLLLLAHLPISLSQLRAQWWERESSSHPADSGHWLEPWEGSWWTWALRGSLWGKQRRPTSARHLLKSDLHDLDLKYFQPLKKPYRLLQKWEVNIILTQNSSRLQYAGFKSGLVEVYFALMTGLLYITTLITKLLKLTWNYSSCKMKCSLEW